MLDQITEYISSIPKPVIIGIVVVVITVVGFFLWKKFGSKDSENEVIKGEQAAAEFAENVQKGLDREDAPMMSAMTPEYAQEVQQGLQDLEKIPAPATDDDSDSDLENYA
jgi:hypothetical protein